MTKKHVETCSATFDQNDMCTFNKESQPLPGNATFPEALPVLTI